MKVLHVGKYPPDHSGGLETAFFALSERLAAHFDLDAVCSSVAGKGGAQKSGRLSCLVLPTWFTAFSTPVTPSLVGFLRRARGYDLIQLSFQNPMSLLAYLLARPPGKLVVWWHHDIVRQRVTGLLLRPFMELILRRADAIVVGTRSYARSSEMLRRFSAKVRVIPYGIELEPYGAKEGIDGGREIRRRLGGPLLLFVGRHVYYKGLRHLIEAMSGLDAKLLVIGRGPLEAESRRLAARLGLGERVIFEDVPAGQPLAPYMHAADLLVLPSTHRTESFGLVLLEAMACGKPVVATELGTGTSEVCLGGVNGLVVPPGDAAALRKAINAIITDGETARRMGEAGRSRAASFSSAAMAESFRGLYETLCGARAGA
ncbi:MAG: glycosyltransferase [Elusimicrobia bacterium]|nr:glycosyltransferase [Elusimicrobiota bacterium]